MRKGLVGIWLVLLMALAVTTAAAQGLEVKDARVFQLQHLRHGEWLVRVVPSESVLGLPEPLVLDKSLQTEVRVWMCLNLPCEFTIADYSEGVRRIVAIGPVEN